MELEDEKADVDNNQDGGKQSNFQWKELARMLDYIFVAGFLIIFFIMQVIFATIAMS